MKAFVTGSTGLLGNNLVRMLEAAGHTVVGLVRSEEKGHRLLGDTRAILIKGDLGDVQAFASALEGCEAVFHTAAYFREYYQPGDHWQALEHASMPAGGSSWFVRPEDEGLRPGHGDWPQYPGQYAPQ